MQQVAEGEDVHPAGEHLDAFIDEFLHDAKLATTRLQTRHVTFGHVLGRAGDAGVNEQQVRFQFRDATRRQNQRAHFDLAVRMELHML